jgi:hypothetical protein
MDFFLNIQKPFQPRHLFLLKSFRPQHDTQSVAVSVPDSTPAPTADPANSVTLEPRESPPSSTNKSQEQLQKTSKVARQAR